METHAEEMPSTQQVIPAIKSDTVSPNVKSLVQRVIFTLLWVQIGWCAVGVVVYLALRCLSLNWHPDVPEWLLKTTTIGSLISSCYILALGFKRRLPGTRVKEDAATVTCNIGKLRFKLVAGFVGLAFAGMFAHFLHSLIIETPDESLAKTEEGLRSTQEELFNFDRKGFFESIHAVGNVKSIKVSDVYSVKRDGGAGLAYITAVRWKSDDLRDGFTEVVLYQERGTFVGAQLLLSNGQVKNDWDSKLLSFIQHK